MNNISTEEVLKIEKKAYYPPGLVEHGSLSEITKAGTDFGISDVFPEDPNTYSNPNPG